mmetsp:Transcript_24056/g.72299  ORF Transcript_24056/g.72299 Transcript_24056/m.72299 type:complete len:381 (+) Transcript_24056:1327-2469(+)
MRHAVGVHDLRSAQLVLRRVDLPAQELVERLVAREDQRPLAHLDHARREAVQIRADAHGPARHVRQRERVRVSARRLARDGAGASQVLDADAVLRADDRVEREALLAAHFPIRALHGARGQRLVVRRREVQILVALLRVLLVDPRDFKLGLELLHEPDARARVARDVDARQAARPRVLGRGRVELVLLDPERPRLKRDVVRHQHDLPTARVLRRRHGAVPRDHADAVAARRPARRPGERRLRVVAPDQLLRLKRPARRTDVAREQPDEVVAERRARAPRGRAPRRERVVPERVRGLLRDGRELGPLRRRRRRHREVRRGAHADRQRVDPQRGQPRRDGDGRVPECGGPEVRVHVAEAAREPERHGGRRRHRDLRVAPRER